MGHSRWHTLLHPSPLSAFASSQISPVPTMPSPHLTAHAPAAQPCPAAHATVAYPCPSALHTCRDVVLAHTGPVPPGVHIHGVQTPTPRQAFIAGHAAVP